MLGRAARMIRLPGWKPPVMTSRSSKPEAVPVMEHFTETLFLRDGVAQLATELFYTNSPLTEPQDHLVHALFGPGGAVFIPLVEH